MLAAVDANVSLPTDAEPAADGMPDTRRIVEGGKADMTSGTGVGERPWRVSDVRADELARPSMGRIFVVF